jgi:serine/threonine-protein kinase
MPRAARAAAQQIPAAPAVPGRPKADGAAPEPPQRRQLIGRVIGDKYGVTGLIGEGGMGAVYEAEHLAIGRMVAVKVLHPKHAQKREAITRLQHEARVVGTIGHPNICQVYDMGRLDDGSPYLVMERLHGETLAERIQRQGPVPYPALFDVMLQVLNALGAAHQKGIIHRDLKPDNIFLAQPSAGGPELAKLLDFGISKAQTSDETSMRLTRTGMVMGTPYYMAPEQARGERSLDQRVDLWAVGVLIYEGLSGRRPFLARNYNALLVQILTTRHRSVNELVPGLPAALSLLVDKALSKMREDRFQNAAEFQDALLRLQGSTSSGTVVLYGRRASDRKEGSAPPSTDRMPSNVPVARASAPPAPAVATLQGPRPMPAGAQPHPPRSSQNVARVSGGPEARPSRPIEERASAPVVESSKHASKPAPSSAPVGRVAKEARRSNRGSAPRSSNPSRAADAVLPSSRSGPVSSPPRPVSRPPGPVSSPPRPAARASSAPPRTATGSLVHGHQPIGRGVSQEDRTNPRIVVPRAPPMDPSSISESLSGESGETELRASEDATFVLAHGLGGEATHRDSIPPPADDEAPTFVQGYFSEEDVERTVVDPPSFSSWTGKGMDGVEAEERLAVSPSEGLTPVRRAPRAPRSDPKAPRSETAPGTRKKKKK